ncbi:hypothetical protein [Vibrio sp. SCSIO 43137]|uniref:hypothetical protein n=1 Tax=Vibrio sp. SCSIO 43137 TaxID=3021011 RepID=UPI00230819A5|nr:hypothetical protein [Vibrio sp. SCSIO 43137]WCE28782.1 hypothetical protein PK654_10460 [Vibrio sp. SCSIO 43137]
MDNKVKPTQTHKLVIRNGAELEAAINNPLYQSIYEDGLIYRQEVEQAMEQGMTNNPTFAQSNSHGWYSSGEQQQTLLNGADAFYDPAFQQELRDNPSLVAELTGVEPEEVTEDTIMSVMSDPRWTEDSQTGADFRAVCTELASQIDVPVDANGWVSAGVSDSEGDTGFNVTKDDVSAWEGWH